MTPQELSELDRKVAEAIGAKENKGYWVFEDGYELGLVSNKNSHDPVFADEVSREVWMPSTDWNAAMYAAEKAQLFDDGLVYLAKTTNGWAIECVDRYGYAGNIEIAKGETGPIAICQALLALSEYE